MNVHGAKNNVIGLLTALVIAYPVATWPQEEKPKSEEVTPKSDELALAVANAQKASTAAIHKYSWNVKTDLAVNGESKASAVTAMRFDTEGKLQTTRVGGESKMEKKPGLRGRAQANKIEDFSAYLEKVLGHSFKYIFMSKGTLVDVFDRAKITPSESNVEVAASSLFVKDDGVVMSVDPSTYSTRKLTFKANLDGDAIQGTVDYAPIENGPNRVTRMQIEVPSQSLKIASETYDWLEQK